MKIGLGSFAFRWAFKSGMKIEYFLEKAAGFGAEVVQLCDNSSVDRLDAGDLKDLSRLARRMDLSLECGASGGSRDQLEAGIRRTACMDGHIYRCVVDSDGLAPEAVVANLRELLPLLREQGVTLCAENHFRYSPRTLRQVITEVADPAVAVCLDPLNSITQLVGPEETVRELIPATRTAHIKDARISRSEAGWVISGTPLGEGQLDIAGYMAAVAPRAESLLLESWMAPVDGERGRRTLEQEELWAKNGLVFLREMKERNAQ
jgi:sugar phosphate isomerase/epimerase